MRFIHVYNDDCFRGLEKNGLINKDTGFKIQHAFSVPEDLKYNRLAAKGSKLHSLIKEGRYPFYVDRITGGITYHYYPFDRELTEEYQNLLGDWFLGFQLHESASNRRASEWPRMIQKMGSKGPYDLEALKKAMLSSYASLPDGTQLYGFSHDTPEYYAQKAYAETYEEFFEEIKELFSRRMADVHGLVLPCDSYYLVTKLQDDMGMRTFMPEVGCQIPLMRLAVALARGMARAGGKTWGTYYECWREVPGVGYCMPCFNTDPSNEWYLSQEQHGDDFTSYGENGGSSRLLQRRIYYYTLMSGADYMAEEWGLNCSYSDMQDFTLSAYGECKKEFINTALDFRGIRATVPFAIVLPNRYSCVELPNMFMPYELGQHRKVYMESPLSEAEQRYFGHVEDVLKLFFARSGEVYGNEGHVLTNSRFGDLVDIIYEDASDDTLQKYEYLIDATEAGSFAAAKAATGLKVLTSGNLEKLAAEVTALSKRLLPCTVDGLHWLLSTDEAGKRYLTIFNNEGNERDLDRGDVIHKEADKRVKVSLRDAAELKVVKSFHGEVTVDREDAQTYSVTVPAAGFVIFEF